MKKISFTVLVNNINMQNYTNSIRGSNVIGYEIGDNFIIAQFKDYKTYKYSYQRAGSPYVEQMKQLASQGHGLNSFINKYVKKLYDN